MPRAARLHLALRASESSPGRRTWERNVMPNAHKFPHMLRPLLAAATLAAAGCSSSGSGAGPQTVEGKSPDGTVDMTQIPRRLYRQRQRRSRHAVLQGSGLRLQGRRAGHRRHRRLHHRCQGRGIRPREHPAVPQHLHPRTLWLRLAHDQRRRSVAQVVMHLKAKREGLMLSLGGDAVAINMTP